MIGFVVMARDAIDHPLLKDGERFRAWFWMVARACWKSTKFDLAGKIITLERGQFCASRSQLAEAWGWSPSAVERFLSRLETEQMIGRATGQGRTIITICNYDKYQSAPEDAGQVTGQASGQPADSRRTAKEQGNKNTLPNGKGGEPPSLAERLWSDGLAVLAAKGVPEAKARPLIGKWRKQAGDAGLLTVIADCQAQAISDPVPWIEAAIRARGSQPPQQRRGPADPTDYYDWYAEDRRKREEFERRKQAEVPS